MREIAPGEFDARKWAECFVDYVAEKPSIASDEATMHTWFANAIMAGYDDGVRRERRHLEILRNELLTYTQASTVRLQALVDLFGDMVQDKPEDPEKHVRRTDALAEMIRNQIAELQVLTQPIK